MPGYEEHPVFHEDNWGDEPDTEQQARREKLIGELFNLQEKLTVQERVAPGGCDQPVMGRTAGGCTCQSNQAETEAQEIKKELDRIMKQKIEFLETPAEDINLDELAIELHETAVAKGFWEEVDVIVDATTFNYGTQGYEDLESRTKLLQLVFGNKRDLIHTEVAELTEAVRKEQGDEKELDEAADIIIRLLDYIEGRRRYGDLAGSLQEALLKKANKNKERPRKHNNLF